MKRFLFIIALCAGLQFNMSLCSEAETKPEPSYWQPYAPQFMQDMATTTSDYIASWIPQSVKDTVNNWSTRKKLAIAGTILASLLAIYNREIILEWVNSVLPPSLTIPSLWSEFSTTLKPFENLLQEQTCEEFAEMVATELREDFRLNPEATLQDVRKLLNEYEERKSEPKYMNAYITSNMRAIYLFLTKPVIQENPAE